MRWLRGEILNSCSRENFPRQNDCRHQQGIRPNGSLLAQHKEVTERSSLIPLVDRRMRNALQWNRNVEPKQVLKWRNFQHGMGLNEFLKITQNRFYFEEAFLFLSVDLEGYKLLLFQESPVVDSLYITTVETKKLPKLPQEPLLIFTSFGPEYFCGFRDEIELLDLGHLMLGR